MILYIHRNPLRAGLVERLVDFPWSSYPCLAYGRRCQPWLSRAHVLGLFEGRQQEFRQQVQTYSDEEDRLLENLRQGIALCSEQAAERLMTKLTGQMDSSAELETKLRTPKPVVDALHEWSLRLGLSEHELERVRRPIRGVVRPERDILIHLLWRYGNQRLNEIGVLFGVSYSSVSHANNRGEASLRKDRRLRNRLGLPKP